MRRSRPLLLTLLAACSGADPGTTATTLSGGGSDSTGASATAGSTGALPTTSTAGPTDTGHDDAASTPTTDLATTGDILPETGSTGSTDGTATLATTTTGDADTGTTDASAGETDGTTTDTTGTPCPEGQLGCPCGQGCDPGLVCAQGVCGAGPECGDGSLDPGEQCDDGVDNANTAACKLDCSKQTCGDSYLGPGEQCDDGNANANTAACKLDCSPQVCGDSFVGPGEQCDNGANNANTAACKLDCSKQVCGDSFVGPGEQCDNGNANANTAACKLDCSKQVCGDGYLGPGEQCDDGNQIDGDGCQKTCIKTPVLQKDACGYDTDGVWFQIDYENAFSVSNPTYSYSATPGWGEAQWAPTGKNWPYTVDLFNNAKIIEDQIGTVALLDGTNKAVRTYFGIAGLTYEYATVCVEGRSYSVGSSVTFRAENAANKCGTTGMLANSWQVHAAGVDLGTCFIQNNEFQAVQVQPTSGSGSLSLKRVRVTLHGASY